MWRDETESQKKVISELLTASYVESSSSSSSPCKKCFITANNNVGVRRGKKCKWTLRKNWKPLLTNVCLPFLVLPQNAKKVTFQDMTIPNHYIWLHEDRSILYMVKWVIFFLFLWPHKWFLICIALAAELRLMIFWKTLTISIEHAGPSYTIRTSIFSCFILQAHTAFVLCNELQDVSTWYTAMRHENRKP